MNDIEGDPELLSDIPTSADLRLLGRLLANDQHRAYSPKTSKWVGAKNILLRIKSLRPGLASKDPDVILQAQRLKNHMQRVLGYRASMKGDHPIN